MVSSSVIERDGLIPHWYQVSGLGGCEYSITALDGFMQRKYQAWLICYA